MPKQPEGSTSPRKFSAVELLFYVPDFAIAGTFLITWLAPLTFGPKMIGYLLTVVVLELADRRMRGDGLLRVRVHNL